MLFHKGVLMQDPEGILIIQTENVQSARQVRFTSLRQIEEMATTLRTYVFEAMEVERSGIKVPFKKTTEFNMPEEFQRRLDADSALREAFEGLTPGRQRAYLLHFSQAKQEKTREARIDKYVPEILSGKGLEDE